MSASELENRFDKSIWPALSTLTAKTGERSKAGKLRELRPIDHRIKGGDSDTDAKELAVTPASSPSTAVVMTVTPVAYWPRHWRKARLSSDGSPAATSLYDTGADRKLPTAIASNAEIALQLVEIAREALVRNHVDHRAVLHHIVPVRDLLREAEVLLH